MRTWTHTFWIASASLLLAASTALAQDAILPYREYAKRTDAAQKVGPLTDAAFGANVSLYNGSTSFRAVDISLGGNSAVPVQLARTVLIDDRTSVYPPPEASQTGSWMFPTSTEPSP